MTVASCNLRWGLDRDNQRYDVTELCRRLDADVIGLQETWRASGERGVAAEVADALGYDLVEAANAVGAPHPRKGLDVVRDARTGTGTWGIAVLSRLPMRRLPPLDLGPVPLDRASRHALVTEVVASGDGGGHNGDGHRIAVRFVCAHLSHRPWGALAHLRRARRSLGLERADLADPHPTVMVGDMNMWGPVVDGMVPGLRRAVRGRSWPADRPHSQIDHILVSPSIGVTEAAVLAPVGSDHRPVRARLTVAQPASAAAADSREAAAAG